MEDQSSSMSQEESTSPSTTPDHTLHSPTRDLHMDTDHHIGSMRSPSKWNVSIANILKKNTCEINSVMRKPVFWISDQV